MYLSPLPQMPVAAEPIDPIVLRDRSAATLRIAEASDRDGMRGFFRNLSPESRYTRFFTPGEPSDLFIDRSCDSTDPKRGVTLVAIRGLVHQPPFAGVASYFLMDDATAEVAFAVDDHLHGKGVATAMLKRLAPLAASAGFEQFWATMLADNRAMLDVFRDSGLPMRTKLVGGCVDVVLSLTPSGEVVRVH
jgi:RimJ/RimL family protein N-acetyltransferase